MKRYLLAVLAGTVGTAALKVLYDNVIADRVPDRVLITALDFDSDDLGFSILVGAALPIALIPLIRMTGGKTSV